MKFTHSWLLDHLDTDADAATIAETLTNIGLEIESLSDDGAALAPFVIGYVEDAWQHPNADRLRVCMVNDGTTTTQVICGAPNARKGMKGVFAPAGTHIPGTGVDLKVGDIRGEKSSGMLCSEREMGLSDEHDGIIDLPEDAPVGASFAAYAGLDDPVYEIGITPNRGDCLGVYGIARDLAAAGIGSLKTPDYAAIAGSYDSPVVWKRDDAVGDACPFVAGRHFRGVKNGPSPAWMQRRLKAIGLRPISALVDITNYVTFDLGRPLHVFDADKVKGGAVTMRYAKPGETILALDGRDYTLADHMLVIADDNGPEGIGGVMGGELSGCTEETTNVFLEVALFDPIMVAETGRALNINSDARYRFERGLDPQSAVWGAEVAARLVQQLCGGETSHVVTAGTLPDTARSVSLRLPRLKQKSGIEVPVAVADGILKNLGFENTVDGDTISAAVPGWRTDVECEDCLIEEVLRIHGMDKVPSVPIERETALPRPAITPAQRRESYARKILAGRGMLEAVTWSFMPAGLSAAFGGGGADLTLANPISADLDQMRPNILPNLLQAAVRNADRGMPDACLFEVGPVFRDPTDKGQDIVAGGIRTGNAVPRHWSEKTRPVDAFDAKADAMAVLDACGAPVGNLQVSTDAPDWYHPGRSGGLRLGPNVLAWFGEVHPGLTRKLGLKGRAAAFEIFLDRIPMPKAKGGKARPLLKASSFMPVARDFAFLIDRDVPADQIVRAAVGGDKKLVSDASVFDVYEGAELEGRKSVAIAVTIQPVDRTLTDEEIDAIAAKVVANVEKVTGGVLRG